MVIGLFSSCIIVATADTYSNHFDISCKNNTSLPITDWCVKEDNDYTYANSTHNCEIPPNHTDTIENLPRGYYSICISFAQKTQLHPKDYEQTAEIYLDQDVTFDVAQRKFFGRSAGNNSQTDKESEYVLICSDGNVYPLTPKKK